jgi:hypothetical protein
MSWSSAASVPSNRYRNGASTWTCLPWRITNLESSRATT